MSDSEFSVFGDDEMVVVEQVMLLLEEQIQNGRMVFCYINKLFANFLNLSTLCLKKTS